MRPADLLRLDLRSLTASPLRSLLTMLGIVIGIGTVVLLTSIGEGLHRYVLAQFTQFGTHLVAVMPGSNTTFGLSGATINTVRPLSLEDADALRRLPGVKGVAPLVQGNAAVEYRGRSRRVMVFGTGPETDRVWNMKVVQGRFLPPDEYRTARPYAVLGARLRAELFGNRNPLGERIRVGGERYRVIGVMEPKGRMLGFDLDDTVYLPVGRALALFDREGLIEIDLLYDERSSASRIEQLVRSLLERRHGQVDFTIITQDQMLETLGSILDVLTLAVAVLGGISLVVGGVGILTIMTIAVTERTREIALFRALGAERAQVRNLFLGEAVLLSLAGGLAGVLLAGGSFMLVRLLLPELPLHPSWPYIGASVLLSMLVGVAAGILPALNAASLAPAEGLRSE